MKYKLCKMLSYFWMCMGTGYFTCGHMNDQANLYYIIPGTLLILLGGFGLCFPLYEKDE
jgi:hypothetical protein